MAALTGPNEEGTRCIGWGQEQLLGPGAADAAEVPAAKGGRGGHHQARARGTPAPTLLRGPDAHAVQAAGPSPTPAVSQGQGPPEPRAGVLIPGLHPPQALSAPSSDLRQVRLSTHLSQRFPISPAHRTSQPQPGANLPNSRLLSPYGGVVSTRSQGALMSSPRAAAVWGGPPAPPGQARPTCPERWTGGADRSLARKALEEAAEPGWAGGPGRLEEAQSITCLPLGALPSAGSLSPWPSTHTEMLPL